MILRLTALVVAALGFCFTIPVTAGLIAPAEPFDVLVDWFIAELPTDPSLTRPEQVPTLVVLQHGLVRSATSIRPLERALQRHGYDTLSSSYPSLTESMVEHAERLDAALDRHLAQRRSAGRPDYQRIAFVGHSMGGLVIRCYLERPDAVDAWACIFCGTPQRGAAIADARESEFVARLFFARGAAPEQLLTRDLLHTQLGPVRAEHIGTICGARGDGRGFEPRIPGEDDRMVGLAEAQLAEQDDTITLFTMHTWLAISPPAVHQVLHFLRHQRFDPLAQRGY